MSRQIIFALSLFLLTGSLAPLPALAYTGTVIDGATKRPVEDAIVTLQDVVVRSDHDGKFQISGDGETIGLRAYGYARQSIAASELKDRSEPIVLTAMMPKALYLSFYGIGSTKLREAALGLIDQTELNAVVIDVKGDRGMIAFKTALPLAERAHSNALTTMRDAKALLDRLHRDNVYAIARIVVFKDDPLATARPDLAVKRAGGAIFRDRERLAWTDPFNTEVWDYNISIALEAARLGFDEIQFDYVRFPDAPGLKFSKPINSMAARLGAISGFLTEARRRLTPYNVFLAADIFGYVTWNLDDTHIGQRLEELAPIVDYVSPMLYPSCFQFGIPGYRNPVAHPYEIVFLSLQNARERGIPSIRFRPWLQAFRDYAFDHREFTGTAIRAQISAAEKFGSDGWMLWNPRNQYTADGLKVEGAACKQDVPKVVQSSR
jgi:hypothetical protein